MGFGRRDGASRGLERGDMRVRKAGRGMDRVGVLGKMR